MGKKGEMELADPLDGLEYENNKDGIISMLPLCSK